MQILSREMNREKPLQQALCSYIECSECGGLNEQIIIIMIYFLFRLVFLLLTDNHYNEVAADNFMYDKHINVHAI